MQMPIRRAQRAPPGLGGWVGGKLLPAWRVGEGEECTAAPSCWCRLTVDASGVDWGLGQGYLASEEGHRRGFAPQAVQAVIRIGSA